MPFNRKEYMKEWRNNNKEYDKKWRNNNKEYLKEYRENNKEKINEYYKEYYQTEKGKKIRRIDLWKQRGIKTDDYDFLYDWYMSINNCLICDVELISGSGIKNQKHLDHDHETGEPTMVVCGYCNLHILK